MKPRIFLKLDSYTGLIFEPEDAAALADILTRAIRVKTNWDRTEITREEEQTFELFFDDFEIKEPV